MNTIFLPLVLKRLVIREFYSLQTMMILIRKVILFRYSFLFFACLFAIYIAIYSYLTSTLYMFVAETSEDKSQGMSETKC